MSLICSYFELRTVQRRDPRRSRACAGHLCAQHLPSLHARADPAAWRSLRAVASWLSRGWGSRPHPHPLAHRPLGRRGAHRVRAFSREAPPLRFPRASRPRVAGDSPTQVTGGSHAFDSELATSQNRRASVFYRLCDDWASREKVPVGETFQCRVAELSEMNP